MLFDTAGKKGQPVIVMINGSFTTGKGFLKFAERYLADSYYVVIPTYDGHHEGPEVFDSRAGQAGKILNYLKQENLRRIAVLQGLSMGAEVALELMHQIDEDQSIKVEHCFFDGGPYFHFPAFFRKIMYVKFKSFLDSAEKKGTEAMMENSMIKWMLGDMSAYEENLRDVFGSIPAGVITKETIKNETEACYTFDFPEFSPEMQRKFVFSWSDNEPAKKSQKEIIKHYPEATYESPGSLGHSGFMIKDQRGYAKRLMDLAKI